jgi:hypothetical protein
MIQEYQINISTVRLSLEKSSKIMNHDQYDEAFNIDISDEIIFTRSNQHTRMLLINDDDILNSLMNEVKR